MKVFYRSLFLFILFISSFIADAQQIAGGEITYTCGGNDNYTVKVVLYAKCPNPNLPSSIKLNIFSPAVSIPPTVNMTSTGSDETIKACINKPSSCEVSSGEKTDAIIKRTYTVTIKLPSKQTNWRLSIQESNTRTNLSTIVDVNTAPLNLKAEINNNICNSSSTFDNNPLFFSASKTVVTYDPGIKTLDGDNIKVALIQPMRTNDTPLTYKSGFSVTNPVSGTPVTINQNNGVLTFTPSMPQETSTMAIQVRETRGTTFAGSVMREMYFQTLPEQTAPPQFAGSDTINFCANTNGFSTKITGSTPTPGGKVDVVFNNKAEWPGAFTSINHGTGTVEFNLSANNFTGVKPISLTLIDDKCGSVSKTYYVKINPRPLITNPTVPVETVLCLKPFDIIINATLGKQPYSYLWSTGETTQKITVKLAINHSVTVSDANGCTSLPWVKRINSPINFEVGKIRCIDSLIRFYDVSKGQNTIPVSQANPLDSTRSWTWDFGDSTKGFGSAPSHKFAANRTYNVTLTISDDEGCTNTLSKRVKIYSKPKPNFRFSDSCQVTENSDLKVLDLTTGGDTTISNSNIVFDVDGQTRTSSFGSIPTPLRELNKGLHSVFVKATNDAGCVDTLTKRKVVLPKPLITLSPIRNNYFYRCDSPGFPDTTFAYSATPVGEALKGQFEYSVDRPYMAKLENKNYIPNTLVSVPFTVKPNSGGNLVMIFKTKDVFGCTNDSTVIIKDPITPDVSLKKYYCFLNDTLKLTDLSFPAKYKWGLKTSVWDMKDGETQTTFGFANHAYTTLDEALVMLNVTDLTGCSDKDSIQVYLAEPDTSQFQIIKPLACVNEAVKILGIKNNYINSWYYRYADTITSIYDSYDKLVNNPLENFGKSTPANLDDTKLFPSKQYNASTVIFYNEKDPTLNLIRISNNPIRNIPSSVCHIQVTKPWRVLERQPFKINDTYDHCFDSLKIFDASLLAPLAPFTTIDTASWKWSLYAQDQTTLLNAIQLSKNDEVKYQPATSLFTAIATERNSLESTYKPYIVKSSYQFTYKFGKDSLTCTETTERKVANEKVAIELDSAKTTCANYFFPVPYNSAEFIERFTINGIEIDERKDFTWRYGDSVFVEYPFSQKFSQPGRYDLIGSVKNYYGCEGSDTMIVLVNPSPVAKLGTDTVCYGVNNTMNGDKSIAAPGSKITNYYWFYSSTIPISAPNTPDISFAAKVTKTSKYYDKFEVGTYPIGLAVVDSNGCYALSDIRYAKVNDLPGIDFTALAKNTQDQDYLGNEPIQLIPSATPNVAYSRWSFGDGTKQEDSTNNFAIEYTYPFYAPPFPKEKNMYDVTLLVKTKEGCVDSVTKKLDVNVYFELPNVFSPNEDGLHDNLLGVGKGIKEIKEFKIFNRWGEVIHTVSGIPEKDALKRGYLLWDGVYNGQVQPVGTYVYYAVVKTGYGNDLIKKGNLTLLK